MREDSETWWRTINAPRCTCNGKACGTVDCGPLAAGRLRANKNRQAPGTGLAVGGHDGGMLPPVLGTGQVWSGLVGSRGRGGRAGGRRAATGRRGRGDGCRRGRGRLRGRGRRASRIEGRLGETLGLAAGTLRGRSRIHGTCIDRIRTLLFSCMRSPPQARRAERERARRTAPRRRRRAPGSRRWCAPRC